MTKLTKERRTVVAMVAELELQKYHRDNHHGRPSLWDEGWRFDWSRSVAKFGGKCWHEPKKLITLSIGFTAQRDLAFVHDTIKHEVGHAMAGPVGHAGMWTVYSKVVGYIPRSCMLDATSAMVLENKPWLVWCPNCGKEYHRTRAYRPNSPTDFDGVSQPLHRHCSHCQHYLLQQRKAESAGGI